MSNLKGIIQSYYNGIGFVKIMGRECGYITTKASFISKAVDILLIPEQEWVIHGDKGLIK